MTGSVYVAIALFLGVLLYVVLRRRSAHQGTDEVSLGTKNPPVRTQATSEVTHGVHPDGSDPTFLKPATLSKAAPQVTQPRGSSLESGSSHPAYPVAPAKYAEYTPKGAPAQRRESSQAAMKAAVPQGTKSVSSESSISSGPESQAAPWYPEPPANYAESGIDSPKTPGDEKTELPRIP